MAVITTLTTAVAPWNEGTTHVQWHGYGSTHEASHVLDGQMFVWVVNAAGDALVTRPGTADPFTMQGLVGGYVTQTNGETIHALYVDLGGTDGGFDTHTCVVTDTFDRSYYVDDTGGSDGNAGTSTGAPKATLAGVVTAAKAAGVSGEHIRILLKRGETFTASDSASTDALWTLHADYVGCVTIDAYDSGADPIVNLAASGNGSQLFGMNAPGQGLGLLAIRICNLEINGDSSSDASALIAASSARIGDDGPNVICYGLTVSAIGRGIEASDTAATVANRADRQFAAMANCAFVETYGSPFFGMDWTQYMLIQDCDFGLANHPTNNAHIRGTGWAYCCFDNISFDRTGGVSFGNVLRINGGIGATADDYAHHLTFHKVTLDAVDAGIALDSVSSDQDHFSDIEVIGCVMRCRDAGPQTGNLLNCTVVAGSHHPTLSRLRVRDSAGRVGANTGGLVNLQSTSGVIDDVVIEHCTVYWIGGDGDNGALLQINGTGIAAGAVSLWSNYGFANGNFSFDNRGKLINIPDEGMIGASDYNHFGRETVANFANVGGTPHSLASWQSLTSLDANSTATVTASHNLTDITETGFDGHPASGTGLQVGVGEPGRGYVDADFLLWDDTTPDAGAYQRGGVAPDGPDLGGAVTRSSLSLGLRLGL